MPLKRSAITGVLLLFAVSSIVKGEDAPKSYPISLKADDVHELAELNIEANGLTITAKNIVVVPIRCERGITGAMILGDGEFVFAAKDAETVTGKFRAAMLRFAPDEQKKLMPLEKANVTTDHAAHEISQHLLNNIFRYCWH